MIVPDLQYVGDFGDLIALIELQRKYQEKGQTHVQI